MKRIKRLVHLDRPGIRKFNSYFITGIEQAYCVETYDKDTNELVETSMPRFVLKPDRRRVLRRSKYNPHQGKQECERRIR